MESLRCSEYAFSIAFQPAVENLHETHKNHYAAISVFGHEKCSKFKATFPARLQLESEHEILSAALRGFWEHKCGGLGTTNTQSSTHLLCDANYRRTRIVAG